MKISEYVRLLKAIKKEHGDIEVYTWGDGGSVKAKAPELAYKLVLQGRERIPRFWVQWNGEERKGAKVVRI